MVKSMVEVVVNENPFGKIFQNLSMISFLKNLNPELISELKNYLDLLNTYYIKRYNRASLLKDKLITSMQKTERDKLKFIENMVT